MMSLIEEVLKTPESKVKPVLQCKAVKQHSLWLYVPAQV